MIEARPVWKPLHRQPVFEGCRYYTHSNESTSDRFFETGICLPSGSNMTDADVDRIIDTLCATME
jgi:pyridoxal phosphate-dependent aminotransferase EpsN